MNTSSNLINSLATKGLLIATDSKEQKIINACANAATPIDTAKIQRAQSAKHYQETASAGTHAAMLPDVIMPVLSNPVGYLDKLARLAPSSEYFAASGIVSSLGYTLVNSLLWEFRRRNAKANAAPEPTVDIFNGMYADMFEKRADAGMSEDNGHARLPDFNPISLSGVYMRMLHAQRGNPDLGARFPAKMPHEILHEMQTQDRTKETEAAYDKVEDAIIAASPAARAIGSAGMRIAKKFDEHQVKMHRLEQDYILRQLQASIPAPLADDVWSEIPLYVQYKWTSCVYRQTVKAIADERASKKRDTDRLFALIDMVGIIHLEMEAAARTEEIKLAFELGKLDERHEVPSSVVSAAAVAEAIEFEGNKPAAPAVITGTHFTVMRAKDTRVTAAA